MRDGTDKSAQPLADRNDLAAPAHESTPSERGWQPPTLTVLGQLDAITDIGGSGGPDGETLS